MGLMTFIMIRKKYASAISAGVHTRLWVLQYIYRAALHCHPCPPSSSSDPWHTISVLQAHRRMHLAHLAHPRMGVHLAHSHTGTGLLVPFPRLRHYSQYRVLFLGVRSSQAQ